MAHQQFGRGAARTAVGVVNCTFSSMSDAEKEKNQQTSPGAMRSNLVVVSARRARATQPPTRSAVASIGSFGIRKQQTQLSRCSLSQSSALFIVQNKTFKSNPSGEGVQLVGILVILHQYHRYSIPSIPYIFHLPPLSLPNGLVSVGICLLPS